MGCACCMWRSGVAGGSPGVAGRLACVTSELADRNDIDGDVIRALQAAEAALADDNRRLALANRALNAKKNKIKSVSATDRKSTGVAGRPR